MKITGFTLFWSPAKKMWQRSIQPEGEPGWLIDHISDEEAQRYFAMLSGGGSVETWSELTAALQEFCDALA